MRHFFVLIVILSAVFIPAYLVDSHLNPEEPQKLNKHVFFCKIDGGEKMVSVESDQGELSLTDFNLINTIQEDGFTIYVYKDFSK